MLTSEERWTTSAHAFETTVVSTGAAVSALSQHVAGLLPYSGSALDPRFFVATVDERVWIPRVVVVTRSGSIAGVVYFKERKFSGLPTGILYGDDTLHTMVLSDPDERDAILQAALQAVMKRYAIWALRILVPPTGSALPSTLETGRLLNFDTHSVAAENHCDVLLPESYDAFLHGLGSKTRRNFRYYRRRSEESGFQYVPVMRHDEFVAATSQLFEKSVIGADRNGIERALRIFSVVNRPVFAGLRHPNGNWLSIIGGWIESDHTMIFLQMNNDKEYPLHSFSIVMRGYFIEDLIARDDKVLRFWAGLGGPLQRYRMPVPAVKVFLDKRGFFWTGFRSLLRSLLPLVSKRIGWVAEWIAWKEPESNSNQCL